MITIRMQVPGTCILYEYIPKSNEELNLDNAYLETHFNIHALTAGYNSHLSGFNNIDLITGTQFTLYGVDKNLQTLYRKTPVGLKVYLQLRPSLHKH